MELEFTLTAHGTRIHTHGFRYSLIEVGLLEELAELFAVCV
jgi:hypothetical protein